MSRDLENARFSIDVEDLVERVGTFREEFTSVQEVSEKGEVWHQLTKQLQDLASLSR